MRKKAGPPTRAELAEANRAPRRLAHYATVATAIATVLCFVVPLFAIATDAYPAMPVTAGTVSRLLLLFVPQALAVSIPIAVPTAVLVVSCWATMTRRLLVTTAALAVAGTLITATLSAWIAPVTNAAYRTLAFGDPRGRLVNGLHLDERGGAGYQFQIQHRWTPSALVPVLAAFAIAAGSAIRRTSR